MPKQTVSQITGCTGCPLRDLNPNETFVPPKEGYGLRLAFGEAPGEQESIKGEPFVGGSGRMLDSLYNKAGVKLAEVTVANVINCRPKDNLFPTDSKSRCYISEADAYKAVQHCYQNHNLPLIQLRPWKRLDLIGEKALRFIGQRDGGIFRWRGSPIPVPAIDPDKPMAIATLHPSYLMRDQAMYPVAAGDLAKSLELPPEHYNLYPTVDEVRAFTAPEFAFDIETTYGADRTIKMVGLSAESYKAIVVPFTSAYIEQLKRIFWSAKKVIMHNGVAFDLPILARDGVLIQSDCEQIDTMLLHHLRFPQFSGKSGDEKDKAVSSGGHDLAFVGSQMTNKGAWKHDKLSLEHYCARDVDVTLQVYKALLPLCQSAGLMDIYRYVQVPMAKICQLLKETGIKRDPTRLKEVRERLQREIAEMEVKLPDELKGFDEPHRKRILAPEGTLNEKGKSVKYIYEPTFKRVSPWKSDKQKKDYLYKKLGLPEQLQYKTNKVTVDKDALEKLQKKLFNPKSDIHNPELGKMVSALREINLKATLLANFFKADAEGASAIIHPNFNLHGTDTGRLSSSGEAGNLQNQPEEARYMFVARHPGWKIISIDWSGGENRLVAHLAQDKFRLANFERDPKWSEHKYLASIFSGIAYEEVVKEKEKSSPYAVAKAICHGSDRMLGAQKIANKNDLDFYTVRDKQAIWKKEIHKTVAWQKRVIEIVKKQGWLANPFGRRGFFYTDSAATQGVSFLPQSTLVDIMFRAMIGLLYERINWPVNLVEKVIKLHRPLPQPALLTLTVHDEFVTEAPAEMVPEVVETMKAVMEQPWAELDGFHLPVTVSVGDSWGELEDYISPKTL